MSRGRPFRPQRAPVFIGCEGQSEMSYAGWLRNVVRDLDLPFHLELSDLGLGAGDPLSRIEAGAERIARFERNRAPFVGRFLFLDTDQLAGDRQRQDRAHRAAREHDITVIWQEPTHEALLLRHFRGRETRRPPTKQAADAALAREWAGYRKPSTSQQLEARFVIESARRVAADLPALAELLRMIGLAG